MAEVERAVLVGNSMGGPVCLEVAHGAPERVAGIVPPPRRVQEVGRLAPPHLTVAAIEGAAHAMNFSHPGELAHLIRCWLDGREITEDPDQPGIARILRFHRRQDA